MPRVNPGKFDIGECMSSMGTVELGGRGGGGGGGRTGSKMNFIRGIDASTTL